uniref:Uncharacterized protein n=1 Tax=Desulfovibrio sp. U5L TaxID=596152 RepID=I2Q050_9BACT
MPAVSNWQHELHRQQAVPSFDGAPLGLALHGRQGQAVRKLPSSEVAGLRLADTQDQKDDAGKVGVAVRVHGEMFLLLHAPLVAAA